MSLGVDGPGGTPLITPISDIRFIASGGASAGITSLGGGSAQVSISTTPTPCFPVQDAFGGSGMAGGSFARPVGIIASGAASATVTSVGGSAVVLITVPQPLQGATGATGATGPAGTGGGGALQVAGSGGATAISSTTDIEFAGSGGVSVAVQSLGGGSARVLLGLDDPSPWQESIIASGGVVAFYRFNDGGGMFARPLDSSGNGHHGSAYINAPLYRYGPSSIPGDRSDTSIYLNDINGVTGEAAPNTPGYVLLSKDDIWNQASGSVECFFAWDGGGSAFQSAGPNQSQWQQMFSIGRDTQNYFMFTPNAGASPYQPRCDMVLGGVTISAVLSQPLSAGWHHLVATWDGVTLKVYLDGGLAASVACTTTLASLGINPGRNTVNIGKSPFNDPCYRGAVDEFILWNRVLSAPEVASRMTFLKALAP